MRIYITIYLAMYNDIMAIYFKLISMFMTVYLHHLLSVFYLKSELVYNMNHQFYISGISTSLNLQYHEQVDYCTIALTYHSHGSLRYGAYNNF